MATDGVLSAISKVSIVVVTDSNRVPVFTKEMNDTTVAEGQALAFGYLAVDPDGQALTYSLVAPVPTGAVIDPATGAFSWTPGFDQAGSYDIAVMVTDGQANVTSKVAKVTVDPTNRPPAFVNVLSDATVNQNQALTFKYTATDPDADVLEFAAVSVPEGASIDSAGNFAWTPSYAQVGKFNVVVSVTDGQEVVVDSAEVTVTKVNLAPYFTESVNDTTLEGNTTYTWKNKATDPNGDQVIYSIVGTPPTRMTISASLGTLRWVTGLDHVSDTAHTITIRATDATDASLYAEKTVHILIVPPTTDVYDPIGIPKEFSIKQNFPNPFNPSTKIYFGIPEESRVVLKVYNLLGQEVATLVNEVKEPGHHYVNFNASNLNSGIYLYQIEAKNYKVTKKMMLVK